MAAIIGQVFITAYTILNIGKSKETVIRDFDDYKPNIERYSKYM